MDQQSTVAPLKLNGENWVVWKFQTSVILKGRGWFDVVTGERIKPTTGDDAIHKWIRDDAKAQELIVTRMEQGPLTHLLSCESSKEMWTKLKSVYDKESVVSVHLLQQKFFSMEFGDTVSNYISQLEEIKTKLKQAGEEISDKMIITKILMSLPEPYKHFRSAWESVPTDKQTLDELTSRLLLEEERTNPLELGTTALAAKRNPQKRKLKCFICQKPGHFAKDCFQNKEKNENKKCTFCKKIGHDVKACYFRKNKEQENRNATRNDENKNYETNAFIGTVADEEANNWCMDTGASEHMCWDVALFEELVKTTSEKTVKVGNGEKIEIKGIGKIRLWAFNGEDFIETTLSNVLYVPKLKFNLFSAGCALDKGYSMTSDKDSCKFIDKAGKVKAIAERKGKLFIMSFKTNPIDKNVATLFHCNKIDGILDWHNRMAHINFDQIRNILKNNNVEFIDDEKPFCPSCLIGKQHKLSFDTSKSKTGRIGELVHADLCGPFEIESLGGAKYFLLLKDDFSKYRVLYFINQKSETTKKIHNYLNKFKNMTDREIVTLRTDNGLEFLNQELRKILEKRGIRHEKTCIYTPQQNGRAERENRTLVEAARTMLHNSTMHKRFWAEAINTAAFVLNRTAKSSIKDETPYKLWNNKDFDINRFKSFGIKVSVHIPKDKRRKLDPKSETGILVGYSEEVKGYRIYFEHRNKVELHRDVVFYPEIEKAEEKVITLDINEEINSSRQCENEDDEYINEDYNGNQQPEPRPEPNIDQQGPEINELDSEEEEDDVENESQDFNDEIEDAQVPQIEADRRGRIIKPPDWLKDYDTSCFSAITENITYEEAMNSDSARLWTQAIENELSVLQKNNTWTEVPRPVNKKVIDSKWVLKIKNDGQYKARLVARGFQQKCDGSFYDIYAPVAKVSTFRIFVVVANKLRLPIHQMDVQGAFLYGDINDEVFMSLPNSRNKSKTVCKLNKSIYGLKKSPKCWNSKFDNLMKHLGFNRSQNDFCLYIKSSDNSNVYVLLYVDDLLILGSNLYQVENLKKELNKNFEMKDLGIVNNYLGIHISQNLEKGFTELDQSDYLLKVLERFGMLNCKAVNTPLDANFNFNILKNNKGDDKYIKLCRQMIGSLMYAVLGTRPDLSFSVSALSRFMETANESLFIALKRVLRYIKGTLYLKLRLHTDNDNILCGYVDSDWGGDIIDRKSTTGYIFKMYNCPVSWASKKQQSVSISSTESEYVALSVAVTEACWLRKILMDFNIDLEKPVEIYEDNQSAISIANNPENNKRLKHLDIKHFFIKEKIEQGLVNVLYIRTEDQVADILTKPVPRVKILKFREHLCLVD